jgi:hypothetical protein
MAETGVPLMKIFAEVPGTLRSSAWTAMWIVSPFWTCCLSSVTVMQVVQLAPPQSTAVSSASRTPFLQCSGWHSGACG